MDLKVFTKINGVFSKSNWIFLGDRTPQKASFQSPSMPRPSFIIPMRLDHLVYKYVWGVIKQILHGWYRENRAIDFPSVLAIDLSPFSLRLRGDKPFASTSEEKDCPVSPLTIVFEYYRIWLFKIDKLVWINFCQTFYNVIAGRLHLCWHFKILCQSHSHPPGLNRK